MNLPDNLTILCRRNVKAFGPGLHVIQKSPFLRYNNMNAEYFFYKVNSKFYNEHLKENKELQKKLESYDFLKKTIILFEGKDIIEVDL